MKIYSAALALALLVFGSLGPASASTAPAAFTPEINLSTSCSAGASSADLALFAPNPREAGGYLPCGACSLSPCKFAAQGTNCGPPVGGTFGHCWDVYGTTTCTEDELPKCQCWRGDLP